MGLAIFRLFRTGRDGRSIIASLLIQSVFIGIFYAIFNVIAHAAFLSSFDETALARAWILSGIAGIGLTGLYSLLRPRMKFSLLSVLTLTFILLLTLALWILLRSSTDTRVLYLFFMMLGPSFLLLMLAFRDTAGLLFSQQEEQKISAGLNTALIAGLITGSFLVPAMLAFNIGTHNIFLISIISIIVISLAQADIITRRKQYMGMKVRPAENRKGTRTLKGNKYLRSIALFFALSVIVLFFVQYSFMAVTRIRYPAEYDMANFLGLFEGCMMIVALLINSFLFSGIVRRQGIDIALSLSPVLIGLFMVVVIILGSAGDISTGTPGFLFFFLILAFSRVFSRSLNIAVEKPSLNILCQPLGQKQGRYVLSLINGMGNEIAVVIAGLLLTVTGTLAFVKLIHFSWVLVLLTALWVFAALRLYREYRKFIRIRLAESEMKRKVFPEHDEKEIFDSPGSAGLYIDNNYFELITASEIHESIIDNRLVIRQVVNKAENNLNPDLLPLLRYLKSGRYDSNGIGERLQSVLRDIEAGLEKEGLGRTKDLVSTIEDSSNKKMHLRAIMAQQAAPVVTDLMRLIRDEDNDIRRETLYIAGKFRIGELLPEICECLDNQYIAGDAYAVLRSFGEQAFTALSRHFARSSGNIMTRRLITRLFAEEGGRQAIDFLLPRLWSVHRLMRKEAVRGLQKCEWKARGRDRQRLRREVLDIIGLLSWNLSASIVLKENNDKLLYEALEKESEWWMDFLFDILSLLYDKTTLEEIRNKLHEGTLETVNYAFEMLDIIIDEGIKPQLKALLDRVSARYRFRKLSSFFPGRIPDYDSLIYELVNKDYNHIGVWTKALAIRQLYKMPKPEETDFLVALLFGVHRILREESCRYLQKNYDDVYSKCSYRLPKLYRDQLDEILKEQLVEDELVYRKLRSLLLLFPGIPENILTPLAENL
ncbi:MAG: hypothetical protein V2I34_00755, partial [Bacteroidales bacterium]|nr:hypothetical protein [Bacteroidales bacterium]